MQLKTFGAWASFLTSVGAGALTQVPEYSHLALPVAMLAGILILALSAYLVVFNRRTILDKIKLVEPAHFIFAGLAIAAVAAGWQVLRGPQSDGPLKQRPEDAQEIARLTTDLAEERTKTGRLPADASTSPSFKPAATLTPHDRQERQIFTSKALDLLGKQLAPVLVQLDQVVGMKSELGFRHAVPGKGQEMMQEYVESKRVQAGVAASAFEDQIAAIKAFREDANLPRDIAVIMKPPDQTLAERLRAFATSLATLRHMSKPYMEWSSIEILTEDRRETLSREIDGFKRWHKQTVGTLQQVKEDLSK